MTELEPLPRDAQAFIDARMEELGGMTATQLVEDARPADSPLHGHIDWDRNRCVQRDLETQARHLLRRYKVVVRPATPTEKRLTIRKYSAVPVGSGKHVYKPTDVIARNPVERGVTLQRMHREVVALFARYASHEEFFGLVADELAKLMRERNKDL